jgi:hypothetical protein
MGDDDLGATGSLVLPDVEDRDDGRRAPARSDGSGDGTQDAGQMKLNHETPR